MDAMASKFLRELLRRQSVGPDVDGDDDDIGGGDEEYESWWWTPTGLAVRYTIVIVVFALLLLYFVGGYWHAKHRMRKRQPLLAYHRWMVSRRPMFGNDQQYQPSPNYYPPAAGPYSAAGGPPPETYAMHGYYRPPPPAYNGAEGPPPVYQPPEGASKIMAEQGYFPAPQNQQQRQMPTGFGSGAQGSSSVVPPEATASGARQ